MRNERQALGESNRRNFKVMRADPLSDTLQGIANLGVVTCGQVIERQRGERLEESLHERPLIHGVSASRRAKEELRPHYGADGHLVGA